MSPQDQINNLTKEAEDIQLEIESKEKNIVLLKSGIQYEKRKLKLVNEGIEMYKKQLDKPDADSK